MENRPLKATNATYFLAAFVIGISIISSFVFSACNSNKTQASTDSPTTASSTAKSSSSTSTLTSTGDLVIPKSEVTSEVKFYPVEVDGTKMELIAVKANDDSIRTAFNTCQVCYDSGKGYYKQEGNELICQNCKNRFKIEQVEKVKGGCNPLPILKENRTEDDKLITISKDFMAKNKEFFSNWKK